MQKTALSRVNVGKLVRYIHDSVDESQGLSTCRALVIHDHFDGETLLEHGLAQEDASLDIQISMTESELTRLKSLADDAVKYLDTMPELKTLGDQLHRVMSQLKILKAKLGLGEVERPKPQKPVDTEKLRKAERYLKRNCHPDITKDLYLRSLFNDVLRAIRENDHQYILSQEQEVRSYLAGKNNPGKVRRSKLASKVLSKRKRRDELHKQHVEFQEHSVSYMLHKYLSFNRLRDAIQLYKKFFEYNLSNLETEYEFLLSAYNNASQQSSRHPSNATEIIVFRPEDQ